MDIQIHAPIKAQRLDDEGDPIGKPVELPAGTYSLRSGLTRQEDGTASAWIETRDGDLYEAFGLASWPS